MQIILPTVPCPRPSLGNAVERQHGLVRTGGTVVERIHRHSITASLEVARVAAIPLVEASCGIVKDRLALALKQRKFCVSHVAIKGNCFRDSVCIEINFLNRIQK